MRFVFVSAPVFNVHRWNNQELRAFSDEPVSDARITQIVTNADADFPQGESQTSCFSGTGRRLPEELNRHALGLFENHLAISAHYESGVMEIIIRCRVLAAHNQVT